MKSLVAIAISLLGQFAWAQTHISIYEAKVTCELNNESLESCFNCIERQIGLQFAFLPGQIDLYTTITLPKATRTVSATLDLVLRNTPLTYQQMNNSIVIFEKPNKPRSTDTSTVLNENIKVPGLSVITGKVTGPDGLAVPEVNVHVKGIKTVITNLNGQYRVEAKDSDTLVFSFVGYKTVEAKISGRTVIDVLLEEDISILKNVVINAGYYKVKEQEQTGNIARVTAEDIENQPVSNPLLALEGRIPGVYIHQYSGVPGGGVSIQIRGTNSLRPDANYPLYIIDGVPFPSAPLASIASREILSSANPLSNINIADIESIEILKDADATAIYGSRGANGVVLITTKASRRASGMQVSADFRQGIGKITRTMDLLNSNQWLEMRKEAFKNDGAAMTAANAPDLLRWDTTRYTDWQKMLIGGTAKISDFKASVSGGPDEFTRYFFSTNHYRESTVFPGDFSFRKSSAHFNFDHTTHNDGFRFSLLANYTATDNDLPRSDPFRDAIELSPVAPGIYDDIGKINWENGTWVNPFGQLRKTYTSNIGTAVVNTVISYRILPGLYMNNNLGYTNVRVKELQKNPMSSSNPAFNPKGSTIFGNNEVNTWIVEPQLEYSDTIGGHGKIKLLAGTTFQQTLSEGRMLLASGYTNDDLLEDPLSAPLVEVRENDYAQYRYNAIFGRINFDWKGKYILNLTGRRDGSSRFGPRKRFANFGAIGTAWIFSSEPFIENTFSFLSYGKLRASYGITGSDQIGDYQYMDSYTTTSNTYNGLKGMVPTRLYNPDYSWETNEKAEAAIELGFAGNRVLLSASYYNNHSSNQLVGYSLPVITGQPSIQYNLDAVVQNTGVEVMLNSVNVSTNNFSWKTYFNATAPQNKLISYPNLKGSAYSEQFVIGQPLSIQRKYHYLEVNSETGVYTFQDVSGDGSISAPSDYLAMKKISQQFFGGIQNNIRYKNWQLDVFFQFVKQSGNSYIVMFENVPGSRFTNQPVEVMDRWQQPGDITSIQKFTQRNNGTPKIAYSDAQQRSDYAIIDASFVRLKNISLSWKLRSKWLRTMHLQQGNIYVQGQNLLTFTKYKGFDPEIPATSRSLPPLRILMAGLQLTF